MPQQPIQPPPAAMNYVDRVAWYRTRLAPDDHWDDVVHRAEIYAAHDLVMLAVASNGDLRLIGRSMRRLEELTDAARLRRERAGMCHAPQATR